MNIIHHISIITRAWVDYGTEWCVVAYHDTRVLLANAEIFQSRINEHCIWSCVFRDIRNPSDPLILWSISTKFLLWNGHTTSTQCILIRSFLDEKYWFHTTQRDILKFFSDRSRPSCHHQSHGFIKMLTKLISNYC